MEDQSLNRFCDQLYSAAPGTPGSVNLEIGCDFPSEMFEALLLICVNGLRRWYSVPIDPSRLSVERLQDLVAYFASFNVVLSITAKDEPIIYRIDNKSYLEETEFKNMRFQIAASGKVWTIQFAPF